MARPARGPPPGRARRRCAAGRCAPRRATRWRGCSRPRPALPGRGAPPSRRAAWRGAARRAVRGRCRRGPGRGRGPPPPAAPRSRPGAPPAAVRRGAGRGRGGRGRPRGRAAPARGWARGRTRAEHPLPGHAQVRPESDGPATPVHERDEQVLAAAVHPLEPARRRGRGRRRARSPGRKMRAARESVSTRDDPPPLGPAPEVARGDLDLGELRHAVQSLRRSKAATKKPSVPCRCGQSRSSWPVAPAARATLGAEGLLERHRREAGQRRRASRRPPRSRRGPPSRWRRRTARPASPGGRSGGRAPLHRREPGRVGRARAASGRRACA